MRFALLFGSAAMGTDTPASDIDLLVALRDSGLLAVVDLEARLRRAVGRRVDLVRLDDARRSPLVLAQAIHDGRVLIDRESVWPTLQARGLELAETGRLEEAATVRGALARIDEISG